MRETLEDMSRDMISASEKSIAKRIQEIERSMQYHRNQIQELQKELFPLQQLRTILLDEIGRGNE